jgi:monovalent cation:H+ antiporter-2, CPA2 family
MFVVAISDPASSRRAVLLARRLNRNLQILVRTRYLSEVAELRRLGANAIIPEEFETSVEIFARVLREYEVPRNLIMNLTERVRAEHYEVLRDRSVPTMRVVLPHREVLEQLETGSCWIRDTSPAVGQTVGEMRLRSVTGATLVAARRAGSLQLNPGPDFRFQADDSVVLLGDRSQLNKAMCLLDPNLEQPPLS